MFLKNDYYFAIFHNFCACQPIFIFFDNMLQEILIKGRYS